MNDIKSRFRKLKALEIRLRYGETPPASPVLVWDKFFDLTGRRAAKYSLETLSAMSREECREAIAEYLSYVFETLYGTGSRGPDVSLYIKWGLPADAAAYDIKKKFREMALLAHPDTGGSTEAFLKLMEEYRKLSGEKGPRS